MPTQNHPFDTPRVKEAKIFFFFQIKPFKHFQILRHPPNPPTTTLLKPKKGEMMVVKCRRSLLVDSINLKNSAPSTVQNVGI